MEKETFISCVVGKSVKGNLSSRRIMETLGIESTFDAGAYFVVALMDQT